MAWVARLSSLCLSSVTLLHPRHRLELFGNIFALPNSSGTRTVYIKIFGKNSKTFRRSHKLNTCSVAAVYRTVCPRLPVITFCFPNEEEAEMRRTDDVSVWPWSLTLKLVRNDARVVEYPLANFGDRLPRLFISDLWPIARWVRRPLDSGLSIERPATNCCCLVPTWLKSTYNCFSATKF